MHFVIARSEATWQSMPFASVFVEYRLPVVSQQARCGGFAAKVCQSLTDVGPPPAGGRGPTAAPFPFPAVLRKSLREGDPRLLRFAGGYRRFGLCLPLGGGLTQTAMRVIPLPAVTR